MTNKEIYEKFDAIGSLSFSTVTADGIESRIAHFFAYDDEGLYLRTMDTKPFYFNMVEYKKLSVSGIFPKTQVDHDEKGLPYFAPGYTMRISGEVRELTSEEIEKKSKENNDFYIATFDIKKYPSTRVFVLHKANGEHYDFDFEMQNRDHKLLRTPFAFGGAPLNQAGFTITQDCIACGACLAACTFKAISEGAVYSINKSRCDECGSCRLACPVSAIELRKRLV